MKKKIKIDFSDFWGGFDKKDNYFYNLLIEQFDVEISNQPDYLFFSVFGQTHKNYNNCVKIAYYAENIPAPLGYCQWAFSNDYLDDERNFRLPHYLLYDGYYELVDKKVDDSLIRRKFCNFIVSNPNCGVRNDFFMRLKEYKHVDSGGRFMNNIGAPVGDKVEFQSEYKFSFAFENNAYRPEHPGYTTEKIMQPMRVNSIPIYWGNPVIDREFNTKSFINWYDYNSPQEVMEHIIELDNNDEKYMEMLREPWFIDNKIPEAQKKESVTAFLYNIFE